MKNQNQAKPKTAKTRSLTPAQKGRLLDPLRSGSLRGGSACAILPDDPFQQGNIFEIALDWIGQTMETEISQGDRAVIIKREDMSPWAGELVVGYLKTGHLVFGAHTYESSGVCRIAFINPDYPAVYYPEKHFAWLYPVASVRASQYEARGQYLHKTLEFHY